MRKKYPKFLYKGYSFKRKGGDLHISFDFRVPPDISFSPKVVIKGIPKKTAEIENLVFHLGLVEMLSYWKATASPHIVVEAGVLNKEQIRWFEDLIFKGMGEYFYRNKIGFRKQGFLKISCAAKGPRLPRFRSRPSSSALVPVGGGKDAAVTLELLMKGNVRLRPFVLNLKKEQREIIKAAKAGEPVAAEREMDPRLLELNRKGYLNGHTPFSAYLAFLSVLCAALFGAKYVVLSNERSSNEGNVEYLGHMINHQYSKSFEFEKKFRRYLKKYLAPNVEYFSFLRPLWELQIARLFAKYPKYFAAFLSCNEARKTASGKKKATGTWCGSCAKCLFVFLALYPFAGEKQTVAIFKKNLLDDAKLKPLFEELTGKKRFKPFECVGTAQETRAALALQAKKDHPLLHAWNRKHFLPRPFESILKRSLK
ncbi:MAG: hypothetical protein Q8P12_03960 [bacterium]|nr:hypothetical protein [bacterium]